MTDDLVKRLRDYRIGCGIYCDAFDSREPLGECIEAADYIEKLEQALRDTVKYVSRADHHYLEKETWKVLEGITK